MRRDITAAMRGYVPRYYDEILEAREILAAEVPGLVELVANIDGYADQMNPLHASAGLDAWERIAGLAPAYPDADAGLTWNQISAAGVDFDAFGDVSWDALYWHFSQVVADRRSRIAAKLRGQGTVSKAHIQRVAESFTNGSVSITEDAANYKILVTFTGTLGIPTDMQSIMEAIRDNAPAHLAIEYKYTYMSFGQLTSYGLTFGSLTAKGLTFGTLGSYSQ